MQEQIQNLQFSVMELKARIFDMSENHRTYQEQQSQIFSALAQALDLPAEKQSQLQSYIDKIEELKANQIVVDPA